MVDELELVLLAVGALGLLGVYLLFQRIRIAAKRRSMLKSDEGVEQTFREVFSTAVDGGEGLIEFYMARHKCGRTEAMKRAIEEGEREERSSRA